jgi:streptomycin 6-kinase
VSQPSGTPGWAPWEDRLRATLRALHDEWALTADGPGSHGSCALVVPVRTDRGVAAVLKVSFPHEEARLEHLALRHWNGRGAVRLLRADPSRFALLLERLSSRDLTDLGDVEACSVVAGLYADLHVPAPPQLDRLTTWLERWIEQLAAVPRSAPVPHRMVEHALSIARAFTEDPATDGVLVHGDLHYENVLEGERQPWLAIDPKPLNGDPHFEPAPMLWNRWEGVVASGDVRDAVRRRFHTLVDDAGLDEERARDWVVLRLVLNAVWELEEPSPDREWTTTCITIAKAVQD